LKRVAPRALRPSLIQLIAAPDKFRGAEIGVSGFYSPDNEPPDGIIFFDKESARMGFLQNAIHVRFGNCRYVPSAGNKIDPQEGRNMQPGYVFLRGVFEPSLLDDAWPYAGEMCSVTLINRLPDPKEQDRTAVGGVPHGGRR
jgi:hypothetical protein